MLPLTEADQGLLLRLARQAVEAGVCGQGRKEAEVFPDALREKCGAFVTLEKRGQLRGCIGQVEAFVPLYLTVCECALAAALRDPRFEPVAEEELPELRLEISVLSPLFEISPDEIEVGRHGLMVSQGAQRGLLLPQVAVHWKWDRERFLEETCGKAGLEPDAWRHGAKLRAFTAQVFAEPPHSARSSHHAA